MYMLFILTIYLIETPFNTFAYRADQDQAAVIRAAWSGSTLLAHGNMIYLYWWCNIFIYMDLSS